MAGAGLATPTPAAQSTAAQGAGSRGPRGAVVPRGGGGGRRPQVRPVVPPLGAALEGGPVLPPDADGDAAVLPDAARLEAPPPGGGEGGARGGARANPG